jgi:hypothetical protein
MKIHKHLTPVAAAAAALLGATTMPVLAFEPVEFGNGIRLDSRINFTYTLSQRLNAQDPVLAGSSGSNDGNNNFNKGAVTANRLGALLDAKLSKGASGLVLSASAFYDDAYHRLDNGNSAGSGLPNATYNPKGVSKAPPFNAFTDEAKRYHGGYARVLDAYGYTSFELGGSRANVRLGRHVVSWGEALFFPGISLAQAPADGTKTGVPGTETKDQLLPEDQVSFSVEVTPRWSLLGHAQFNFHPTLAAAPGSFLNTSDGVGPGGVCLGPWASLPAVPGAFPSGFTGCSFGNRGDDILPGKTGQWGLGTRYRVTDETEVGLYYLNYHDRTPIPEINAFTPGTVTPAFFNIPGNQIGNGSYRVRYFDNVKLIGATFSTTFNILTVAGELSYKQGAPVLVNTLVNPAAPNAASSYIPNPTRADITQFNINAFSNLGRTFVADSTILLGEISYVSIGAIEARKAPGVENLPAANQAFFPASDVGSFNTKNALAVSVTASLGYPGIFEGWDLSVPISYSQQVKGRTLLGGVGGEGDKRMSLGATFTYRGNLSLGVTYLGFLGSANLTLKENRLLTDRDQLSIVAKYSF